MTKLSFIIPIFNLEGYIEDCIHSLLNQNIPHSEYEIICVNDGSTDTTLEILQKLASSFSNIVIINQENKGVSAARNNGMRYAKGEYIWFIDGDDLIASNCLNQLISFMNSNSLPLLRINFILVKENFKIQKSDTLNIFEYSLINSKNLFTPMAWNHIFRKNIIETEFNTNLKIREDSVFMSYYIFKYYPYYQINFKIYFYRQRNSSIMHDRRLLTVEENIKNIMDYYLETKRKEKEYCLSKDTTIAYNKLIAAIKADYLLTITKLPNDKFQIYYKLAIKNKLYPIDTKLSYLLQKTNKENDFKTNLNIKLANIIKIAISLRVNLNLINRMIFFYYKKNYK